MILNIFSCAYWPSVCLQWNSYKEIFYKAKKTFLFKKKHSILCICYIAWCVSEQLSFHKVGTINMTNKLTYLLCTKHFTK